MLTAGSLFSGYGGLSMAVEAVFGARTAWVSDIDKAANAVLSRRFPGAPNLGDITGIDWADVEPVDIMEGGSPCQDVSTAGQRKGMTDGTRSNLWVVMREAIATIRPRYVVWENVGGSLSATASSREDDHGEVCGLECDPGYVGNGSGRPNLRALGRVLGDLASLGYDAQWRGVRASDVGACHQRLRIFVLAWRRDAADPDDAGLQGQCDPQGAAPARRYGRAEPGAGGPDLTLLPTPNATEGRKGTTQPAEARRAQGHQVYLSNAIGSLLPTPRTSDTNGSGAHGTGGMDLRTAATMLPTPRATDGVKGGPNQRGSKGDLTLPSAATSLPTPRATRGGSSTEIVQNLPTPSVADALGGHERRGGSRGDELLLPGIAKYARWGDYAAAIARHEQAFGRPAPEPTIPTKRGGRKLSGEFTEWMMGLPHGWIWDLVEDGTITNNDALKLCGNGVVPAQAAYALGLMLPAIPQAVAA